MAEKRMFSKKITNSDDFLDMPKSAQALYFHLSMEADDDGFMNSPKRVMRAVACTDDDMKILVAKGFIIPFKTGVIAITHWKINNYIRCDRYTPTKHVDEKSMLETVENGMYRLKEQNADVIVQEALQEGTPIGIPSGIPSAYQGYTQYSIDKDSIDEISLDKNSVEKSKIRVDEVVTLFNTICKSFPKVTKISESRKKAVNARANSGYTIDDFKKLFIKAESSSFLKGGNNNNWKADFDWLIKDANMAKTLDGNYEDRGYGRKARSTADRVADMLRNGELDD